MGNKKVIVGIRLPGGIKDDYRRIVEERNITITELSLGLLKEMLEKFKKGELKNNRQIPLEWMRSKKFRIYLKMERDFKDELQKTAIQNIRSLSNFCEYLILTGLQERGLI